METIKKIIKENTKWFVVGCLVIVVALTTAFMILNNKKTVFKYEPQVENAGKYVFEFGEEIDYRVITNQYSLKYDKTVSVPANLNEEQLNDVRKNPEYSFVKIEPIDTKQITHKVDQGQLSEIKKLDSNEQFITVTSSEPKTEAKKLKLEVFYSKDGAEETKVAETEVSYIVVDTVPPTLENVQDMSIAFGTEVDTNSIKAKDPIDGELKVEVSNSGFDKSTPGTYDFTAKAVDSNGLETSQGFKVTVEEEKVAAVDNSSNSSLPATGGSSSSGSQSGNNGSSGSGSTGSSNSGNSNGNNNAGYTPRCYDSSYGEYDCNASIMTNCEVYVGSQYFCSSIGKAPWEVDPTFDVRGDDGLELCKITPRCVITYIEDEGE